jgi:hypothetical protein
MRDGRMPFRQCQPISDRRCDGEFSPWHYVHAGRGAAAFGHHRRLQYQPKILGIPIDGAARQPGIDHGWKLHRDVGRFHADHVFAGESADLLRTGQRSARSNAVLSRTQQSNSVSLAVASNTATAAPCFGGANRLLHVPLQLDAALDQRGEHHDLRGRQRRYRPHRNAADPASRRPHLLYVVHSHSCHDRKHSADHRFVVNGASFQAGIVPNSWITIEGSNLYSGAPDTWSNAIINGNLPQSLDGVSVSVLAARWPIFTMSVQRRSMR